jgi:hypothetical protein
MEYRYTYLTIGMTAHSICPKSCQRAVWEKKIVRRAIFDFSVRLSKVVRNSQIESAIYCHHHRNVYVERL